MLANTINQLWALLRTGGGDEWPETFALVSRQRYVQTPKLSVALQDEQHLILNAAA